MLTITQIKKIIKHKLVAFSPLGTKVTDSTIPDETIDVSYNHGGAKAKDIFRAMIVSDLKRNKHDKTSFPAAWLKESVKDIAKKMLMILIMLISVAQAQLVVNLGANKTETKNAVIAIGLTYAKSLDSLWTDTDFFAAGNNSVLMFTPELAIQSGSQDAFNSISLKATGMLIKFGTVEEDGLILSDPSRTFHVFPASLGVETNNTFNNINALFEAGWVPWWYTSTNKSSELLKRLKVGAWLQAGYKIKVDTTITLLKDESLEDPGSFIFRLRANAGFDSKAIVNLNGLDVGFVGNANAWYDVANGALYHSIDLRGRFYLSDQTFIDLTYFVGSGAPLFNSSIQYGIGATVKF